jgi:hypothetical protein
MWRMIEYSVRSRLRMSVSLSPPKPSPAATERALVVELVPAVGVRGGCCSKRRRDGGGGRDRRSGRCTLLIVAILVLLVVLLAAAAAVRPCTTASYATASKRWLASPLGPEVLVCAATPVPRTRSNLLDPGLPRVASVVLALPLRTLRLFWVIAAAPTQRP